MYKNYKNKIGILLAAFALSGAFVGTASAATAVVFSDGFEAISFTKWTQADTGALGMWKVDTSRYTGRYSAHVIGGTGATNDVIRKTISTENYANATFSFMYRASGLDYKTSTKAGSIPEIDKFFAEYSVDGTNWTVVKEIDGKSAADLDGLWRNVKVFVPTSANLQIRFRAHLSDSGDRVWIDDVTLSGEPTELSGDRCKDGLDNDYDGYADKSDDDCGPFYRTLTVVKEGVGSGTVSSSPAGISCGVSCVAKYVKDSLVILTATVTRGSVFAGWSGSCEGTSPCTVSMGADKTVVASFDPLASYILSVANNPVGSGKVTAVGINCGSDCSETMYVGETATLVATPAFGFEFESWTGCDSTISTCLVAIESDVSVTANYKARTPGICGNAVIDWNEGCDDGNTAGFDGCSATCTVESGFVCTGQPSQCFVSDPCFFGFCGVGW